MLQLLQNTTRGLCCPQTSLVVSWIHQFVSKVQQRPESVDLPDVPAAACSRRLALTQHVESGRSQALDQTQGCFGVSSRTGSIRRIGVQLRASTQLTEHKVT